ncbi:Inactive beta-amylase 9 [Nymphaea thermarum]|nr:Inactive beta-amylase 9 [Nymphaea thermarum]
MEVSVIGSAQFPAGRKNSALLKSDLAGCCRELAPSRRDLNSIGFGSAGAGGRRRRAAGVSLVTATRAELAVVEKEAGKRSHDKKSGRTPFYVALPLDTVSPDNNLNHMKAVSAGLKALKLLGVTGVSVPVWWGIVGNESEGKFNWSAYQSLAELIRDSGLKLRFSLCLHGRPNISLPSWVVKIGEREPDIFFRDRAGKRYMHCLSLAVDELPVLAGKSPMQVYGEYLSEFKSSFSSLLGTTITDISVSLGPDGELRYPSFPENRRSKIQGVGEFQCYDKHMLSSLRQHAESSGNTLWGQSGPHDAPNYNHWPHTNNFFKDSEGSWETPYGDFFLGWYSGQLIDHGDRILSLASQVFGDSPVTIFGKVPLVHSWYKSRSHSAELTAGFYNTDRRNGYTAIARMFAANSATLVLPGMDLSDAHQPSEALSSPESVISQIRAACFEHGVSLSGENTSVSGIPDNFSRIKENLKNDQWSLDTFNYCRMGAYFFSPEHWPKFTEFFRGLELPEKDIDDLPDNKQKLSFVGAAQSEETLLVPA